MKKFLSVFMALTLSLTLAYAEGPTPLEIGAKAPNTNQELKDVSGVNISLEDVAGENGLLVIFTCNTCPYVLAWQDRYPGIAEFCAANEIGLVMVNSNEARRHTVDSYDNMVKHAKEYNYDFYYAVDANHALADAFGATKTPDVFLFNSDMELLYKGAIDDNHQDANAVKDSYLSDAMTNMLKGESIDPNYTRAIGCSIKRVE